MSIRSEHSETIERSETDEPNDTQGDKTLTKRSFTLPVKRKQGLVIFSWVSTYIL